MVPVKKSPAGQGEELLYKKLQVRRAACPEEEVWGGELLAVCGQKGQHKVWVRMKRWAGKGVRPWHLGRVLRRG